MATHRSKMQVPAARSQAGLRLWTCAHLEESMSEPVSLSACLRRTAVVLAFFAISRCLSRNMLIYGDNLTPFAEREPEYNDCQTKKSDKGRGIPDGGDPRLMQIRLLLEFSSFRRAWFTARGNHIINVRSANVSRRVPACRHGR